MQDTSLYQFQIAMCKGIGFWFYLKHEVTRIKDWEVVIYWIPKRNYWMKGIILPGFTLSSPSHLFILSFKEIKGNKTTHAIYNRNYASVSI